MIEGFVVTFPRGLGWEKKIEISAFNKNFTVEIDIPKERTSDTDMRPQLEKEYYSFMAIKDEIMPSVEKALCDYYNKMDTDEIDQDKVYMKKSYESSNALGDIMKPTLIVVDELFEVHTIIYFACGLLEETTLAVKIVNGEVVQVGREDDVH